MIKAKIEAISSYLPSNEVTNETLENEINQEKTWLIPGLLHKIFGIKTRYKAQADEQASDLAVEAARPIVHKYGTDSIDCLIFASACSDLLEPATSNIVQFKLGLKCPVMDVKNACNSFVSALQLASSLIIAGQYKTVLICTGEKPSDSVKKQFSSDEEFRTSISAFTFGDAGSAVLVSKSFNQSAIIFQKFTTVGNHWNLCMIQGGGSMFPHDNKKNYFTGQTAALRNVVIEKAQTFITDCFREAKINPNEIDHLFTHQVSMEIFQDVISITRIPKEKCHITFDKFGNTAAASIPLAMHEADKCGLIKKGEMLLLIGMAAGISISFQIIRW